MLLRSGFNTTDSTDFDDKSKKQEAPKLPMTDEEYFARRNVYVNTAWNILMVYYTEESQPFLENLTNYGIFFEHIYDNLDIIKDPHFTTNDEFKEIVFKKITMWNKDIPKTLLKFILKHDVVDYPLLHSSVKHTDEIVKLVADTGVFNKVK